MTLLDHLKSTDEGVTAFADRVGKSRNTIRKIAYGQRVPSLPLALEIVAATGGRVQVADLVPAVEQAA